MAGLVPAIHVFVTREKRKTNASGARSADQVRGLRIRCANACFNIPSFAGLVVIARSLYPIPSRTRPSKSSAPMVLNLKVWKSRSLPGLPRTEFPLHETSMQKAPRETAGLFVFVLLELFLAATGTLSCGYSQVLQS
jgi:hypothetical protein